LAAPISAILAASTDTQGNIIFADYGNHMVSRLNADGTITVLAGNGIDSFSGDNGPARSASLNRPTAAVMDTNGVLYIYDAQNARIRRVGTDDIIATYAGTGVAGYSGDGGLATKAQINNDGRMTLDPQNNLYFTDSVYGVVRRVAPDGTISIYAGNKVAIHSGDNIPATQASLNIGDGQIACDAAGNLYIAETKQSQGNVTLRQGGQPVDQSSGSSGVSSAEYSRVRGPGRSQARLLQGERDADLTRILCGVRDDSYKRYRDRVGAAEVERGRTGAELLLPAWSVPADAVLQRGE
jgi:hypothetical protein